MPPEHELNIGIATRADLSGIVALLKANLQQNGGSLSAGLPRARIVMMLRRMPLIVARRGRHVTGFLMTTPRALNADVPVVRAMLDANPGNPDAYVYGPVCVSARERGQGLAGRLFAELRRRLPGREGILFIRRDNQASIRAHVKMGMTEVNGFTLGGHEFAVFIFTG